MKLAGTDPDSNDMLMIVANVGARMSMLAFMSEVGSGSSTIDFVGLFLSKRCTAYNVIPENANKYRLFHLWSAKKLLEKLFAVNDLYWSGWFCLL